VRIHVRLPGRFAPRSDGNLRARGLRPN
jgi:hypothetical protein